MVLPFEGGGAAQAPSGRAALVGLHEPARHSPPAPTSSRMHTRPGGAHRRGGAAARRRSVQPASSGGEIDNQGLAAARAPAINGVEVRSPQLDV